MKRQKRVVSFSVLSCTPGFNSKSRTLIEYNVYSFYKGLLN